MSPQTKKLLVKFAERANWGTAGNPADLDSFFDFVISAYRNGEYDIPLDEFLDVVNASSKSKENVGDIKFFNKKRELAFKMFMFGRYEDGIKLLRKFEGEQQRGIIKMNKKPLDLF